jgi:hypothetical protein
MVGERICLLLGAGPAHDLLGESARILNRLDQDWRLWASAEQAERFGKVGDIDEDLAL